MMHGDISAPEPTLASTERFRPGLENLDVERVARIVDEILSPLSGLADLIRQVEPVIVECADRVAAALAAGGRLILAGAGTSGQLARSEALECVPTFGLPEGRVIALVAGGFDVSGLRFDAAEDDRAAAAEDVAAAQVGGGDVVIGVSASGSTPYVIELLRLARAGGAATLAVTANRGAPVADVADLTIVVPTGAEVPAGSTRMYAGTAHKIVLNTVTTAAMIRVGRTYGSWMVEAPATNIKLQARAATTVTAITGRDRDAATAALEATGHRITAAVFLLETGVAPDEAIRYVEAHGGSLRRSLTAWSDAPATP